jgi:hypothetical protein
MSSYPKRQLQHVSSYVVRKPGGTVTEEQVKAFAAERLAKYKRLEGGVEFCRQSTEESDWEDPEEAFEGEGGEGDAAWDV